MTTTAPVGGLVAPGFEEVRAAFERNVAERGEIGAAAAADLGGDRSRRAGRRWGDLPPSTARYRAFQRTLLPLAISAKPGAIAEESDDPRR